MNGKKSACVDCTGNKGQKDTDLFIGFLRPDGAGQDSGVSKRHKGDDGFAPANLRG